MGYVSIVFSPSEDRPSVFYNNLAFHVVSVMLVLHISIVIFIKHIMKKYIQMVKQLSSPSFPQIMDILLKTILFAGADEMSCNQLPKMTSFDVFD